MAGATACGGVATAGDVVAGGSRGAKNGPNPGGGLGCQKMPIFGVFERKRAIFDHFRANPGKKFLKMQLFALA